MGILVFLMPSWHIVIAELKLLLHLPLLSAYNSPISIDWEMSVLVPNRCVIKLVSLPKLCSKVVIQATNITQKWPGCFTLEHLVNSFLCRDSFKSKCVSQDHTAAVADNCHICVKVDM